MIEEAIGLVRSLPAGLLAWYYLGTGPFCLGLLYFTVDMSKGAFSHEYCFSASLGMAGLFVWMKSFQSLFAVKVYEHLGQIRISQWTPRSVLRMIYIQTIIHASALIILPVAALITIPLVWTFGMVQMILVCDYRHPMRIRTQVRHCFDIGRQYTRTNHLALLILIPFGLFVFLNVGLLFFQLPYLVKMFTAFETRFTMGGFNPLNSTFLMIVSCLTYLCLDPVIKAMFILQRFYGDAMSTGLDLMAGLKAVTKKAAGPVILGSLILTGLAVGSSQPARASGSVPTPVYAEPAGENRIDAGDLDRQVKRVMAQREYQWRMPIPEKETEATNWVISFFKWLKPYVKAVVEAVDNFFEAIWKFIRRLMPRMKEPVNIKPDPPETGTPKYLFYGIMGISILVVVLVFILYRRKKSRLTPPEAEPEPVAVDVSDEEITPQALPHDQWMTLARELMAEKKYRLAIRAMYLGTLAGLSARHLLDTAFHKSNRDYELELIRRAHEHPELVSAFGQTVRFFDRVWYGGYPVAEQDAVVFENQQKGILDAVG
ncbi:MAG: DUF4129 domain-containing protein [Desulfobacteraceae bacterium]|nr:MAG: DUF4129 domain-containing protein [Desulfobacteraceae bacterium]